MHTQNHRHLRKRLPRATSQKRLNFLMGGITFLAHEPLGHPNVTRRPLEQTRSNPTNFRLVELDRRRLVIGRPSSVRALTLPGAAVEHPVRSLARVHCLVLVELRFVQERVSVVGQVRLRVVGPNKRLEKHVDERPLRLRMITTTPTNMRHPCCQFGNRLRRIKQLQQPLRLFVVTLRPPSRNLVPARGCHRRHMDGLPWQSAHIEQRLNGVVRYVVETIYFWSRGIPHRRRRYV